MGRGGLKSSQVYSRRYDRHLYKFTVLCITRLQRNRRCKIIRHESLDFVRRESTTVAGDAARRRCSVYKTGESTQEHAPRALPLRSDSTTTTTNLFKLHVQAKIKMDARPPATEAIFRFSRARPQRRYLRLF